MTDTMRLNDGDAVMDLLRGVLPSAVPVLVFTSLADLCVPAFSDRCHILVEEDGFGSYRIERPLTATPDIDRDFDKGSEHGVRDSWSGQGVGEHAVQTLFDQPRAEGEIGYRGYVVHLWNTNYHPTGTDVALAQLAVDHALAILRREGQIS